MKTPDSPTPAKPSFGLVQSRDKLKAYFRKGSLPTQENFEALIDSAINRVDDGFAYTPDEGWQVVAADDNARLLALYQNDQAKQANTPAWLLELPPAGTQAGLSFSSVPTGEPAPGTADTPLPTPEPRLHLQADGKVGVGTAAPAEQLDVRGFVASQGRMGNYLDANRPTEVKADGKWHSILTNLNGLHAFEIVAAAYGQEGRGRYALTHAIALSAFGRSRSRVYRKNAWFWGWFQKIQFCWTGEMHSYNLEMRTASDFGEGATIVYHITQLFDDRRPAGWAAPAPSAPAAQPTT